MSQYEEDDDFDVDSSTLADIRKALRASEKRNKSYEQELQSFKSDSRKRDLQGEIATRGLNPKIAAFIPTDIDSDGLGAWLDEFGDVFAPQGVAVVTETGEPVLSAPEGSQQFNAVANSGAAPIGDESQTLALISGVTTKEELDRLVFGR